VDDLADAVSNVHLTDAAPRSGLQDLLHTCGVVRSGCHAAAPTATAQPQLTACTTAQGEVEAFDAFLDAACGGAITKVGEGSFGEAFASDGAVLKVVPIEGEMRVNDDCQKRAAEMVGEVLVGGTLSALRTPAAALDDPAGALAGWQLHCAATLATLLCATGSAAARAHSAVVTRLHTRRADEQHGRLRGAAPRSGGARGVPGATAACVDGVCRQRMRQRKRRPLRVRPRAALPGAGLPERRHGPRELPAADLRRGQVHAPAGPRCPS